MPLPACMWVPWVSFPSLLTANFDFIDVSLLCWHQETIPFPPSPHLLPLGFNFSPPGIPPPISLSSPSPSFILFVYLYCTIFIVNKIAFLHKIICENTP